MCRKVFVSPWLYSRDNESVLQHILSILRFMLEARILIVFLGGIAKEGGAFDDRSSMRCCLLSVLAVVKCKVGVL